MENQIEPESQLKGLDSNLTGGTCASCQQAIPPDAIFCPRCGPPHAPPSESAEGMTGMQAFMRIALIVILFSLLVFYKEGAQLKKIFKSEKEEFVVRSESETAKDADFKLVYQINVSRANIRDQGSTKGKILTVLTRGTPVEVIEKADNWSKIRWDKRTGWVHNNLLVARVE